MAPGTYIFSAGLSVSGQAVVTAPAGVLIYFSGGGLSISGQASVKLSPELTGTWAGVPLAQAPADTSALSVTGGSSLGANGTVYLPAGSISLSGSASATLVGLVAGSATMAGSAQAAVG
jgi:hypothetical protein